MIPIHEDPYRSASSVSLSPEGGSFIIAGAEYPLTRDHLQDIEAKTKEISAYAEVSSKGPKIRELAALEIAISLPPPSPSLVGRTLRVISVRHKDQSKIHSIIKDWQALAKTKFDSWESYLKVTPLSKEERSSPYHTTDLLEQSFYIIEDIREYLEKLEFGRDKDNRAYICFDEDKMVQGIALVENKTNHVSRLATHPNNLPHLINSSIPTRVRGAATQLILHLSKQVAKDNPIRLEAIPEAVPFYKKLYFKRDRGTKARSYDRFGLTIMKLHASTVRRLEKTPGSPFFKEESLRSAP
ncbi:MAG: GNAT family N-acetyltransferase [Simkaniaceae bacterium]|nr:GNAT family N-acetyltransferase [Simkaniaceae bacterium]